jgi:hypothetical protein
MCFRLCALLCVAVFSFASASVSAEELSRQARAGVLLGAFWAARDEGRVAGTEYFSSTSADVPANYLLAAAWDADRARGKRYAPPLVTRLLSDEIASSLGPGCGGWGLGAPFPTFHHKVPNSAGTIYAYTTYRVVYALTAAAQSFPGIVDDTPLLAAECAFKGLFDFRPADSHVAYSNQAVDDEEVVYNIFAGMALAEFRIGDRLQEPPDLEIAARACEVLRKHTAADGFLPYIEGRTDTDPTHHAIIVIALLECAHRLDAGEDEAMRAVAFLARTFIGEQGELIGKQEPVEWAVGESLIALEMASLRNPSMLRYVDLMLKYVEEHQKAGILASDSPRFHAWICAGLAYVSSH